MILAIDPVMTLMLIVFLVIVISVVAVITALSVSRRNRKRFEEAMEKHTRGEVMKILSRGRYTDVTGLNTDPEVAKWNYRRGQHLIQFLRDDGVFMLLDCDAKTYKKVFTGYYGDITYKANCLLDFRRRKSHEEERRRLQEEEKYFFKNKGTLENTVGFYVDAPSLKLQIPSDQMIQCDIFEVKNYAENMFENSGENFFGLDDGKRIIQFINDGNNKSVLIDIPVPEMDGAHQGIIEGMYELLRAIDIYFEGKDLFEITDFEFMSFK